MRAVKALRPVTSEWWELRYKDGMAQRWSIWNGEDVALVEFFARHLYDRADLDPGAPLDILVLGCGTGHMIECLDDGRIQWHGLDYSGTALLKMRLPNSQVNLAARVQVDTWDVNKRPWPHPSHVSAVIASEILEHLEQPDRAIAEALHIAPRLFFTVPFGDSLVGPATRWMLNEEDFLAWMSSGHSVTLRRFRHGTLLAGIIER